MTHILLVDDDDSLRKSIRRGVAKYLPAYTIHEAANGFQAIDVLKSVSICLMVTDLKMPKMDGFELLAHTIENYPDVPVIATTGHLLPEERRTEQQKGFLRILTKPFPMQTLSEEIQTLLSKQADGGTLHNVSPGMFLQLIDMEQKTCTVRIREKISGKMGVLFFKKGKLLDARMNMLQGEEATREIFTWERISLCIQNECQMEAIRIKSSLNALILEATRLKDERDDLAGAAGASASHAAENSDPSQFIASLKESLNKEPALNNHTIKSIATAAQMKPLLDQLSSLGRLLQTGNVKTAWLVRENGDGMAVLPTDPPTAILVGPDCPKDKLFACLNERHANHTARD